MKLVWKISEADARKVQALVSRHMRSQLVRERFERNVPGRHLPLTRTTFWHGIMMCLLTTQQRSGPESRVYKFLNRRPFQVRYTRCIGVTHPASFIKRSIRQSGGIRRVDTIAREATTNLRLLQSRHGAGVLRRLRTLSRHRTARAEREAAHFLAETFMGLGPKQSRNLLQHLGLSRYEIPIDSRIVKWLNDFGFPVRLSSTGLADPNYYEFILDGVQHLCRRARVYPCVFDAAVFTSFDEKPESNEPLR